MEIRSELCWLPPTCADQPAKVINQMGLGIGKFKYCFANRPPIRDSFCFCQSRKFLTKPTQFAFTSRVLVSVNKMDQFEGYNC